MNLIIISHRRSGTHLTIDSILNNFNSFDTNDKGYFDFSFSKQTDYLKQLKEQIKNNDRIIKTHILPNFEIYGLKNKDLEFLKNFFQNTPKIHIVRNGLDVMVSLYFYMKNYDTQIQKLSFEEFLKTKHNFDPIPKELDRIAFWTYHYHQWHNTLLYNNNVLFLKYEDWINDYETTLRKVSEFLKIPLKKKITDIRIKNTLKNRKATKLWFDIKKKLYSIAGKKFTAVLPRSGKSNEWKNFFDENCLKLIDNDTWQLLKDLYGVNEKSRPEK